MVYVFVSSRRINILEIDLNLSLYLLTYNCGTLLVSLNLALRYCCYLLLCVPSWLFTGHFKLKKWPCPQNPARYETAVFIRQVTTVTSFEGVVLVWCVVFLV